MMRRQTLLNCISGIILASTFVSTARADFPRIVTHAPDTILDQRASSMRVPVRLTNYLDTIAGLEFVLRSSNPDLVWFDFENGGVDWTGTMMAEWEWLSATPVDGDSGAIWVRGIANADPFDGVNTPGIAPQQQGVMVNLLVTTGSISYPPIETSSRMMFQPPYGFSDPHGMGIGIHTDTIVVYDTTYYLCQQWLPDSDLCLSWVEVDPTMPYDSMHIGVDSSLSGYVDTTLVVMVDGLITLSECNTGDITGDGITDVADLTELIGCLFIYYGDCANLLRCDFDYNGVSDVVDLTYLIAYLYIDGLPPECR